MEGQLTTEELKEMGHIISSGYWALNGLIIRKVGNTVNYYKQHFDGSWTNYDCKTKY